MDSVRMSFDAAMLAKAWLSVALASSKDADLPVLNRTVAIEEFDEGVRLVATDRIVILHSWVPAAETDLAEAPALEEAPTRVVVVNDPHGRAKGFHAHLLKLASDEDEDDGFKALSVALTLGVVEPDEDGPQATFEGLDLEWVVLDYPNHERLRLGTVDGAFPSWRSLDATFTAVTTKAIALAPEVVGRLAKLGSYSPPPLSWKFGGPNKAARVEIGEFPRVEGLVMPMRAFDPEPEVESTNGEDE